MKTILFKSFFVVIVLMGSVPAAAFAETLPEAITELDKAKATQGRVSAVASAETLSRAIDEALVVHLATIEALSVYTAAINEISARSEEAKTQEEMDAWAKSRAAREAAALDEAIAHAKASRGHKKRAAHCKAILQSDDPVKVVECLETLDYIVGACTSTIGYSLKWIKEAGISWNIEETRPESYADEQRFVKQNILRNPTRSDYWNGYKDLVDARTYNDLLIKFINEKTAVDDTPCVKETITGYSRFVVSMLNQDRYAGLVKRCAKNNKEARWLGYRLIWPCVKRYREMIGEPVETDQNE